MNTAAAKIAIADVRENSVPGQQFAISRALSSSIQPTPRSRPRVLQIRKVSELGVTRQDLQRRKRAPAWSNEAQRPAATCFPSRSRATQSYQRHFDWKQRYRSTLPLNKLNIRSRKRIPTLSVKDCLPLFYSSAHATHHIFSSGYRLRLQVHRHFFGSTAGQPYLPHHCFNDKAERWY
ncbi:hypothetical protein Mp_6g18920 [Marchantia polymorpha subsp. ruderalis]|uniref:Uncharacterized protein n=2 Tax=Marchantia polymorpha TaxID=3197 RepID=A0AAF6BTM2_MARPO|nr:hypothetical protein MARPO_0038s0102 [Marchantia polymorpha]BBN15356.1 hypothetical protein Mp_6g18920 [Marchantia polymorpha subsp. ruderalis]|eukprot:PTQ40789.1 hypothetical protein MARPO_0038s0102 [Marchantia polymorpha]